jgi:hypothetical protein
MVTEHFSTQLRRHAELISLLGRCRMAQFRPVKTYSIDATIGRVCVIYTWVTTNRTHEIETFVDTLLEGLVTVL